MALLQCSGLQKIYGRGDTAVRALDGVSLTVPWVSISLASTALCTSRQTITMDSTFCREKSAVQNSPASFRLKRQGLFRQRSR